MGIPERGGAAPPTGEDITEVVPTTRQERNSEWLAAYYGDDIAVSGGEAESLKNSISITVPGESGQASSADTSFTRAAIVALSDQSTPEFQCNVIRTGGVRGRRTRWHLQRRRLPTSETAQSDGLAERTSETLEALRTLLLITRFNSSLRVVCSTMVKSKLLSPTWRVRRRTPR